MQPYKKGFLPYALCAFLIGIVGGFSTVLGPAFVQDLGIAYHNTTWTALAQAMSTAACAPILGKAGDAFGRRTTLIWGLVVFTLGNLLTALANSLAFMLVARFVVGVGTAAISPVIIAYIITEFPENAVAKGFSVYMLISSASVIFGPTLGSLMISRFGWRSMVLLCVGICAATLAACLFMRERKDSTAKKPTNIDIPCSLFVLVFFSLVLCVPSVGQNIGWNSSAFWGVLSLSIVALVGLVIAQRRGKNPVLATALLKRPTFLLSIAALFLTQGLMQANMTNIIVFVNNTQAENSVISGYAISIMYLGMSLGAIFLGPLADRFQPKGVLLFSFFLTALGCGCLLLFDATTPLPLLMSALGILGLGLGGNGTVFLKVALYGVSGQQAGAGTGTYGLFRDLAAPFGVSVFVPMFTNRITAKISEGVDKITATVQAVHFLALAEILCVCVGMVILLFLPSIKTNKGETHATEK